MTASYLASLGPIFKQGLVASVTISVLAMTIGVVLGSAVGIVRSLRVPVLDWALVAIVEFLRGIPLLVLLFFVFFGLPQLGIHLDSNVAAVVALGLWAMANVAVIVEGAIASIARGQREAAEALGLGKLQSLAHVILPQATRRMIPPFMSLFTAVLSSSSLAALIGVKDLLATTRANVERDTSLWFPLLTTVLFIYFFINFPISLVSQRLERSLR
jgi:His/Glu/Gln/Arg/opine family amino acid ABC transporter permease subunit